MKEKNGFIVCCKYEFFEMILLKCRAGYIEFTQFEITAKDLLIMCHYTTSDY
jgi:hypothetical protein